MEKRLRLADSDRALLLSALDSYAASHSDQTVACQALAVRLSSTPLGTTVPNDGGQLVTLRGTKSANLGPVPNGNSLAEPSVTVMVPVRDPFDGEESPETDMSMIDGPGSVSTLAVVSADSEPGLDVCWKCYFTNHRSIKTVTLPGGAKGSTCVDCGGHPAIRIRDPPPIKA